VYHNYKKRLKNGVKRIFSRPY